LYVNNYFLIKTELKIIPENFLVLSLSQKKCYLNYRQPIETKGILWWYTFASFLKGIKDVLEE
jgi:hypothetical protein